MVMEVLNKAYNKFLGFVDDFANSSSENESSSSVKNRDAWYAAWDDNYMGGLLDNPLTKAVLKKYVDLVYGKQLKELLKDATELCEQTYPMFNEVYSSCYATLGMLCPPQLYVTSKLEGINALSVEVCGNQYILVSSSVITMLSAKEQAFLFGHELSHHQQGNLICHTINGMLDNIDKSSDILGPILLDTIEVPLRRWSRCSEFNADRGGYLCCRDLNAVRQLFVKVGMKDEPSVYEEYHELDSSHPLLHTRFKVLSDYIKNKA